MKSAEHLGAAGLDAGTGCALYRHDPAPWRLVVHHVQPRGMGGADVDSNRITVCAQCHLETHWALAGLVYGFDPGPGKRRIKALARRGYDAWVAAGRPGNPHASYG